MKLLFWIALILAIITITGCLPEAYTVESINGTKTISVDSMYAPAGFLMGIWHGVTLLVSLIVSVFDPQTTVYDVNNTGFGYNAGFVIGVAVFGVFGARGE